MHTAPRILAGWDGSPNADHAITIGVELAKRLNGELTVLLVWDALTQPADWRNDYDHEAAQRDVAAAAGRLVPATVPHQALERLGLAAEAIADCAAELDSDFVVIGRSGKGGLLDRLFGSTTAHVVGRAPCPVIVVPEP